MDLCEERCQEADDSGAIHDDRWWRGFPRWWWWVISIAGFALGILAIFLLSRGVSPCVNWTASLGSMLPGRWPVLIAVYIAGLIVGHIGILLGLMMFDFCSFLELDGTERRIAFTRLPNAFPAAFIGLLEGILYPTSFLVNRPEFVAGWFVLKVAGQWRTWQTGHRGRRVFNRFLFASGLSLAAGALIFAAARFYVLCGPTISAIQP